MLTSWTIDELINIFKLSLIFIEKFRKFGAFEHLSWQHSDNLGPPEISFLQYQILPLDANLTRYKLKQTSLYCPNIIHNNTRGKNGKVGLQSDGSQVKNSYTRKCCNHSMFHGAQVNDEVQLTVSDKNPSSKNGIQTGTNHK